MLAKINKLIKIVQSSHFLYVLLRHGVAAGVEHSSVLSSLKDQDFRTIVDIGANRGQFALVAQHYFPQTRIISFEPLAEPAFIFRRVFTGNPHITLYEMAIGTEDGETDIHVSLADDSSSLLPIALLQTELFPGTAEKEKRRVLVKPLEAVLHSDDVEKPAFMKIDVQGFEKQVLEGCSSMLLAFSYVYVECSFVELYEGQSLASEVISLLENFGFALSGVYNLHYDKQGSAIQGDFLFVRNILNKPF